jgi:hypothetical protein
MCLPEHGTIQAGNRFKHIHVRYSCGIHATKFPGLGRPMPNVMLIINQQALKPDNH